MNTEILNVGSIRVTSLSDGNVVFDPRMMFPETPLEHWSHYYDIFPECFSGKHFLMNLGVFVMSSGGKNVIADTGFGPHGKMLGSDTSAELMDDFVRKGVKTDDIDTVFMSHLHADHVGWNIDPSTSDVPTFPNARYTVHRADWDHFTVPDDDSEFGMEPIERSVIPLQEIGVLDLMDGETELAPGVTAIPTPGHTPGHMALMLSSGRDRALFVGDILINPMHATDTDLPFALDTDPAEAMKVRHEVLDKAENEGITVLGSHLSPPGWGTMVRWEGRRYWRGFGS